MPLIKILLLLSFITKYIYCIDYCDVKCYNGKIHTLCSDCQVQAPCSFYKEQQPLTAEEKQYILDIHNDLRNKVALGQENGFPRASNMNSLSWDNEIANTTSCWANACTFEHDCADVPGKYSVGQNLAMKGLSGLHRDSYIKGKNVLRDMIEDWYNEVTTYNYKYTDSFGSTPAGHFTQIIWGETEFIGCEKIFFEDRGMLKIHLVCNYAPAGNVITRPLYNIGEPCSECECGKEYPALCGNPKQLNSKHQQLNTATSNKHYQLNTKSFFPYIMILYSYFNFTEY